MVVPLIQFLVCAAFIVVAGTFLSKFADAIAEITGFGRLLVGSILLAGATSLPELTVDISAVRIGAADLAVGDLIGSSLMNLLILALLDLSHHSRGRMLSKQAAAHALSGTVSASLMCLVALGLLTSKWISPYAVMGISPVIVAIAAAYLLGVRLVYLDQRIAHRTAVEEGAMAHEEHATKMSLGQAIAGFVACALVILAAGPFLAHAADELADKTGMGGTFVGTTLVAFSTSLPELVASFAALRMGALDLAIGNVFGSNAFNMILLLPLEIVQPGTIFAAVSPVHSISCVAAILATQVVLLGQLYSAENRTRLIEPDALLVILIVFGSLGLVYICRLPPV